MTKFYAKRSLGLFCGVSKRGKIRKGAVAICFALLALQFLALFGCASEQPAKTTDEESAAKTADATEPSSAEFVVPATEKYVRLIGRTCTVDDVTWLPQSGSAVEFTANGTRLSIQMVADDSAENEADMCPRFAVLVDGEVVLDDTMNERTRTVEVFSEEVPKNATVEVIHLSEANWGAVGVESITVESDESDPVTPTAAKDLSIEFIGDSITCAYGVETTSVDGPSTTTTENFMKSYAYFAAKELDADYETVCYSGHGIVSGWSGDGTRNESMLVPPLYDVVARDYDEPWDFSAHPNDVVVINLGTNDFTYTGTDKERMNEFANEYASFLEQVRNCNPKALIVCTMGTMWCEELYPYVQKAVEDYSAKTGDKHITCYLSEPINVETEGIGSKEHPTEATQRRSAHALVEVIRAYRRG